VVSSVATENTNIFGSLFGPSKIQKLLAVLCVGPPKKLVFGFDRNNRRKSLPPKVVLFLAAKSLPPKVVLFWSATLNRQNNTIFGGNRRR
jgi:hypothetical protein